MMGIGTEMMRIEEMRMECRMTASSLVGLTRSLGDRCGGTDPSVTDELSDIEARLERLMEGF